MPAKIRTKLRHSVSILSIVAAGAALTSTVATAAPKPAPAKSPLSGRTFISETVSGTNPLPGGGSITVRFGKGDAISLNAGCNQQRSTVSLAKGIFDVKQPMASTRKACPGLAGAADAWLVDFLKAKPRWRLSGADLALSTPNVTVRLVDRKEAADRPLLNTKWTVTSFISDKRVVTPAATGTTAPTLRFTSFQISGNTGCNTFNGAAVPVASLIVFGPLSTTRRACTDPTRRAGEKAMLKTLSALQNYVIDGKKLTIIDSSGAGLVARTDR